MKVSATMWIYKRKRRNIEITLPRAHDPWLGPVHMPGWQPKLGVDDVRVGASTQLYIQTRRRSAAVNRSDGVAREMHQNEQINIRIVAFIIFVFSVVAYSWGRCLRRLSRHHIGLYSARAEYLSGRHVLAETVALRLRSAMLALRTTPDPSKLPRRSNRAVLSPWNTTDTI